jgi:hypothetical protein
VRAFFTLCSPRWSTISRTIIYAPSKTSISGSPSPGTRGSRRASRQLHHRRQSRKQMLQQKNRSPHFGRAPDTLASSSRPSSRTVDPTSARLDRRASSGVSRGKTQDREDARGNYPDHRAAPSTGQGGLDESSHLLRKGGLAGQSEESQHPQSLPGKCHAQSSLCYRADQCID